MNSLAVGSRVGGLSGWREKREVRHITASWKAIRRTHLLILFEATAMSEQLGSAARHSSFYTPTLAVACFEVHITSGASRLRESGDAGTTLYYSTVQKAEFSGRTAAIDRVDRESLVEQWVNAPTSALERARRSEQDAILSSA